MQYLPIGGIMVIGCKLEEKELLLLMGEMLVGPLSHAGCTKAGGTGGNGVMVLAINIEDFIDLADYESEVEAMAEWVSSARPLPGFNKIYAPGEIEQETKVRLLVDGIDLPEPIWDELGEVAVELGVEMPQL